MVKKEKNVVIFEPRMQQFTEMLEEKCEILKSTAIHYFRKMFATDRNLTKVPENCEFFPRIIDEILKCLQNEQFGDDAKMDAIWVITNMCCINQNINHKIVEMNAIGILLKLLNSPNENISNQCIWAISNIAADCVDCKKKSRHPMVFKKLSERLGKNKNLSVADRKHLFWCINNLTSGGRVDMPNDVAKKLIQALAWHVFDPKTNEPIESAAKVLWSLANIADDTTNLRNIDHLLEQNGLLEKCMFIFLNDKYSEIHSAALRLLGNVAVGNDSQTDSLLQIPIFSHVLSVGMTRKEHRSEIAWICSNIAAGLPKHVEYLLNNDSFYIWILNGIHSNERRLKKECLWIIANMLATADDNQLDWLVRQGVSHQIPLLLKNDDIRLNEKALNAAVHILQEFPWQINLFNELKIVDCIHEDLLSNDSPSVFSTQKRAIQSLLNQNQQSNLTKEDVGINSSKIVLYSKI